MTSSAQNWRHRTDVAPFIHPQAFLGAFTGSPKLLTYTSYHSYLCLKSQLLTMIFAQIPLYPAFFSIAHNV